MLRTLLCSEIFQNVNYYVARDYYRCFKGGTLDDTNNIHVFGNLAGILLPVQKNERKEKEVHATKV